MWFVKFLAGFKGLQEIADISLLDASPISRHLMGADKNGQDTMGDCLPFTFDLIFPDREIQKYNFPSGQAQDELTRIHVSSNHLSAFEFRHVV